MERSFTDVPIPAREVSQKLPPWSGQNPFGLERARAIMEWEATQGTALLRVGAVVALASGGFIAFAFTKRPSEEQRKTAH